MRLLALVVGAIVARSHGATVSVTSSSELESAIAAASSGDKLVLGDGTYTSALTVNKDLIIAAENLHMATLDGEGSKRPLTVTGGKVTLKGLKITNGDAVFGGGVYAKGNAELAIMDCQVTGNNAGDGGGIGLTGNGGDGVQSLGCLLLVLQGLLNLLEKSGNVGTHSLLRVVDFQKSSHFTAGATKNKRDGVSKT